MNATPIENIPEHLNKYIAHQDTHLYTPIDQAGWRYILGISKYFFEEHAHGHYLEGLKKTGISTERIPLIEEMDACLRKFGWRAVAVSGFIPPAIFMEFHELGVLPIACDMRKLENLAYTPAPDIVHEAAGHAPFLADPEYLDYLRTYGRIAKKAIYSKGDMEVYNGIRHLSEIKENPNSNEAEIRAAQKILEEATASVSYLSEAAYLARMYWWTVEYGLIGDLHWPKIYGAGLLSSLGESYLCLREHVKKIPFTIDAINWSYDITRPQPQLFVTKSFRHLIDVLEEFADTMAFRRGGIEGLAKAIASQSVATVIFDSSIQVSGIVSRYLQDETGNPSYINFTGPVQIAQNDKELSGHGTQRHAHGFGSPIGKCTNVSKCLSELDETEMDSIGLSKNRKCELNFESGIQVVGIFKKSDTSSGKNLILTFDECEVKIGDEILFDPSWGEYDMIIAKAVESVFGGPADTLSFEKDQSAVKNLNPVHKTNRTPKNENLCNLYQVVRELREGKSAVESQKAELSRIHADLEKLYPNDWLLRLEILELDKLNRLNSQWTASAIKRLKEISTSNSSIKDMIDRGLRVLEKL